MSKGTFKLALNLQKRSLTSKCYTTFSSSYYTSKEFGRHRRSVLVKFPPCLISICHSSTSSVTLPEFHKNSLVPTFKYSQDVSKPRGNKLRNYQNEDLISIGIVAEKYLGSEKFLMSSSIPDIFGRFNEIIKLFTLRNAHKAHPLFYLSRLLEAGAKYDGLENETNPFPLWRGMMVLLATDMFGYMPKAAENPNVLNDRHIRMFKITEIAYLTQQIHKRIIDGEDISILSKILSKSHAEQKQYLDDLHNANKTATLVGDLLWAQTCSHMAALKCQTVSELICEFLMDYCESEFIFGVKNLEIEKFTVESWLRKTQLGLGSIMGTSLSSTLLFSGYEDEVRNAGYRLGVLLGLTYQAFDDIRYFKNESLEVSSWMDMGLLPVVHKIHNNPSLLKQSPSNIFQEVKNDSSSLKASEITLEILKEDTLSYLESISSFIVNHKPRNILERFIASLKA